MDGVLRASPKEAEFTNCKEQLGDDCWICFDDFYNLIDSDVSLINPIE